MLTFASVIDKQTDMNTTFYKQDVKRIFNENDLHYDWWVNFDGSVEVEIIWGDWKHDHFYLKYIMNRNNYRQISEVITEEDGDDAYSSIHKFMYGV